MAKHIQPEAQMLNSQTYLMYYNRLKDYAMSMFEWEGLPEEINKRFLELKMFEEGRVVFFNDENFGYMVMPVMDGGAVNFYNEPTNYQAVSIGYNKELTPDNAVIIYNTLSRVSVLPIVEAYARRLYEVERAMDVNIRGQKTPLLILADESQRLTMENMYMKYDGNEPFIFGNKSGFDKDAIQVLMTPTPYVTDKLMEYKHNLWNEAMTFLGVGNAKQDKKERLVSDEVSANDEQITGSRYIWLDARQLACEKINEMFGLKVSVDFKFNKDAEREEEKAMQAVKEGENDGDE
jgi:hypothetical protein